MEERLQKVLSGFGVCSRRTAEEWISAGRVRVNGNTAVIGERVDPDEDVIEVDGVRVGKKRSEKRYLLLNKPRGYVTTLSDEKGRKTAAELVADCGTRVYPVGRLDLNSEGLLLFTNDGEFANAMMHPRHEIDKTYLVWTKYAAPEAEELLKRPIELDGRPISVPEVVKKSENQNGACWGITIHEGRNRQIRRMCEAAGLQVTRLKRIREGSVALGTLPVGHWRELGPDELETLFGMLERE